MCRIVRISVSSVVISKGSAVISEVSAVINEMKERNDCLQTLDLSGHNTDVSARICEYTMGKKNIGA